jgi:hypothetical protein
MVQTQSMIEQRLREATHNAPQTATDSLAKRLPGHVLEHCQACVAADEVWVGWLS